MRKITPKEILRTLSASFMLLVLLSFTFVKVFHSHNGDSFLLRYQVSKSLSQEFPKGLADSTNDSEENETQHHCPICDFTLSTFKTEDNVCIPYIESYTSLEQPLYAYDIVKVSVLVPSLRAPPSA